MYTILVVDLQLLLLQMPISYYIPAGNDHGSKCEYYTSHVVPADSVLYRSEGHHALLVFATPETATIL